jgi:putative membrane protein
MVLAAYCYLYHLYNILHGNVTVHKRINILRFVCLRYFLVSYILFHYLMKKDTKYGDVNGDGVLSDERKQV